MDFWVKQDIQWEKMQGGTWFILILNDFWKKSRKGEWTEDKIGTHVATVGLFLE